MKMSNTSSIIDELRMDYSCAQSSGWPISLNPQARAEFFRSSYLPGRILQHVLELLQDSLFIERI